MPRTNLDGAFLRKAAVLWGQYTGAAGRLERQALATGNGELLRKALRYKQNANKLEDVLRTSGLIKGYPIARKFKWKGLDVSIETPAGSVRNWYDPFTKSGGQTYMLYDYGYLRGTEGSDGDQVDVYFGPEPDTAHFVYVVRQMKGPDYRYSDEDKCMVGFCNEAAARDAYLAHYTDERFLGAMDTYPVAEFVRLVKQTKKAPGPVGGWATLRVQQKISELRSLLGAGADNLEGYEPSAAVPDVWVATEHSKHIANQTLLVHDQAGIPLSEFPQIDYKLVPADSREAKAAREPEPAFPGA